VKAVANYTEYPIGHEICVFGRGSWVIYGIGRRCATVYEPSMSCGPVNGAVVMHPDITNPGDSGAGWSRYSKAFGSHIGACEGQGIDSHFMKTYFFDDALDIDVRIFE